MPRSLFVVEDLVGSLDLIQQWVDSGGELNHNPIMLEMRGRGRNPPSLFKFNVEWLKDQAYVDLVHGLWVPMINQIMVMRKYTLWTTLRGSRKPQ